MLFPLPVFIFFFLMPFSSLIPGVVDCLIFSISLLLSVSSYLCSILLIILFLLSCNAYLQNIVQNQILTWHFVLRSFSIHAYKWINFLNIWNYGMCTKVLGCWLSPRNLTRNNRANLYTSKYSSTKVQSALKW